MIESTKALRISLERISAAIQNGKYSTAGHACTDFIKLAYHLECQAELFIGEVLEAICIQIDGEVESYTIPKEDLKSMKDKMSRHMDKLLAAYDAQHDTHEILMNIRYDATTFQFDAPHKYDLRPRYSQRREAM